MQNETQMPKASGIGWNLFLAKLSAATLLFETVSGLGITFLPFDAAMQWNVLLHTVVGAAMLLPWAWYMVRHWQHYRSHALSHIVLLGYVGMGALAVCALSGVVITWQGVFGVRSSVFLRKIHLVSTFFTFGAVLLHGFLSFLRVRSTAPSGFARSYCRQLAGITAAGVLTIFGLAWYYSGSAYKNEFPADYNFISGTNRPFAPSLAMTDTGGAFDARSLAGSTTCGTSGCHSEIVQEWLPSAHRYAAMDPVFQGIQSIMAKQNGAESTRYCGGCHDPISLFSGSKNLFVGELTGAQGYHEGVSCLSCHAIRETDVKGNASYVVTQPREYLWQWEKDGIGRWARDFLIRTYPDEHNKLSKRAFKKPEYCAACHKQFIDQEVNRVGWVQLQNQYDNWAASHWNHKGDSRRTVECRECHMPLVRSTDPAAGDGTDYNRTVADGMHRSHRFLGANQMMPTLLKLEGGEQQAHLVEQWLQGKIEIPEIQSKWAAGEIVKLNVDAPTSVGPNEPIPLRVVLSSNKVGHDFPTGPLDLIQSWLEIRVSDQAGKEVFKSGTRDEKHFIQPGSFLFKAEPVDQYGNLIDRHNLWEMVGVRFRRSLFPGFTDTVQYSIPCPSDVPGPKSSPSEPKQEQRIEIPPLSGADEYSITVRLLYRKVDQFLLNYTMGEGKVTAPVTELARATTTVRRAAPAVSAVKIP